MLQSPEQIEQYKNLAHIFVALRGELPDEVGYYRGEQVFKEVNAPSGFRGMISKFFGFAEEPRKIKVESREWVPETNRDWLKEVTQVATYLRETLNTEHQTRIAQLSNRRAEYVSTEFGIHLAAGLPVHINAIDSAEQVAYALDQLKARIVIAENQEQVDKVLSVLGREIEIPAIESENRPAKTVRIEVDKILHYEQIDLAPEYAQYRGKLQSYGDIKKYVTPSADSYHWMKETEPTDLAMVSITSGSTGPGKPVGATHKQVLANVRQIAKSTIWRRIADIALPDAEFWKNLSRLRVCILHLLFTAAHAFERRMEQFTAIIPFGVTKFPFVSDHKSSRLTPEMKSSLRIDLREANADIACNVPRGLEAVREAIEAGIKERSWVKRSLAQLAIWTSMTEYRAREEGKWQHWLPILPLYIPLSATLIPFTKKQISQKSFGKNFQHWVSGSTSLRAEDEYFFNAVGMVCHGYGTSESNCPITVNTPDKRRVGSAGHAMDEDCIFKVAGDGEILVSGPNVVSEYVDRPNASAKTFRYHEEDKTVWYHTGDYGRIEYEHPSSIVRMLEKFQDLRWQLGKALAPYTGRDPGQKPERLPFLRVLGRADGQLKTSRGEKTQAEPEELHVKSLLPFVDDAIMTGNGRNDFVALVTIKPGNAAREWLEARGAKFNDSNFAEVLRRNIREEIAANHNPGCQHGYDRIMNVAVLPPLTLQHGLNSSMKMQRFKVNEMFADVIEGLYKELERERRDKTWKGTRGSGFWSWWKKAPSSSPEERQKIDA